MHQPVRQKKQSFHTKILVDIMEVDFLFDHFSCYRVAIYLDKLMADNPPILVSASGLFEQERCR
jgi:hypothetical protein